MTISIEHMMPAELEAEDRTMIGQYRPGNIVTRFETGNVCSRRYFEHNLQEYNLRFVQSKYSDNEWGLMVALLESVAMNAIPFWIKEPVTRAHSRVVGEITVSGETTYIFPLDTATGQVVQVGAGIDFAAKTYHAAANLMSDTQANAVGGVTTGCSVWGTCVIAATRHPALDGQYAFLIDPTGTVGNVGLQMVGTDKIVIPEAVQKYTVGASFLSTNASHVYKVQGQFYDGATPGAIFSDTDSAPAGEWLHLRASADSTANDDAIIFTAGRTTSSADSFTVACNMIAPGDFKRWFLPSMSPRLVEWGSAPTAKQRLVFAAADCQRWTRVVLEGSSHAATIELIGDSKWDAFRATEVVYRLGQ
jgi:hypothetical protein